MESNKVIRKETRIVSKEGQKLVRKMSSEMEARTIIAQFIKANLKKGIDFGAIHVAKGCDNKYNCTNKFHFSKDVLFKPGAEKFASLFKLRATWKKDSETWEMLGSKAGVICYVCELLNKGEVAGEGRGSCSVEEKGNANIAIKIAKKRAFLDAILSTGALSDFFTQDLEDIQPLAMEVDEVLPADAEITVSGADDSETLPPIPQDSTKQKQIIMGYVKQIEPSLDMRNKKEIERIVSDQTQLALIPSNFPAIIRSLAANH